MDDEADELGTCVPQCRDAVKSSVLRRLLAAMPLLEALSLGLTFYSLRTDLYPAALSDLILAGAPWENLGAETLAAQEKEAGPGGPRPAP